jgi:acid stress chaperone HdeB
MKILTLGATAATLLATVTTAELQKVDVSAMTCSQFTQSDETRVNLILMWFMGFYAEVQNPQVIDLTRLESMRASFMTFCRQEPTWHVTTAAEGLLGK